MAELTEMMIHGVMTPVIKMETPAAELDKEKALTDLSNVTENARENLGAAPAGFGLGETALQTVTSLSQITKSGWYRFVSAEAPDANAWWGHADIMGVFGTFVCCSISGCRVQYLLRDGVWGPVEWINPRLLLNVEYRTTERYLDRPVYVRCIPVQGAAQGTGVELKVNVGRQMGNTLVRWSAQLDGYSIPTFLYGQGTAPAISLTGAAAIHAQARVSDVNIHCSLYCGGRDLSNKTAYFTVYYTIAE